MSTANQQLTHAIKLESNPDQIHQPTAASSMCRSPGGSSTNQSSAVSELQQQQIPQSQHQQSQQVPQRRKRRYKAAHAAQTHPDEASWGQHMNQQQQLCSVCGDRALGFNFDAVTCESCKAFFRRNAVKEKEQRCNFDGNCEVSVTTRKFCPACRLRKCFIVGMKKDWILDAVQLQQRRERAQRSPTASQPPTVLQLLSIEDDEASQPKTWSDRRPLSAACELLLDSVRSAVGDVMNNVDSGDSYQIRSSGTTDCVTLETPFAITLSFVQRFVQFVKRLPEYGLIGQSDMVALIKGGVFHFTLMRGACTYSADEDSFQFESNRLGGLHRLPLQHLTQSLSAWPAGPELLSRYREFLRAFTADSAGDRLALTLLQLVDFYNPARPQLTDMRLVDRLHRGYTQLLRRYIEGAWPMGCARAVFYGLLNRLSELDKLATDFSNLCHSVGFRCDELSPLLVEVFELHQSPPP